MSGNESSNPRSLAECSTLAAEWKKDLDVGLTPRLSELREMYRTLEFQHATVQSLTARVAELEMALREAAKAANDQAAVAYCYTTRIDNQRKTIERQRATIEFVNKQVRSVSPDWHATIRWLDDSLALDRASVETSRDRSA